MDVLRDISGSFGIFRETFGKFCRDRKLLVPVTGLTLILYSVFYLISNFISSKPLTSYLIIKVTAFIQSNPRTALFADLFFDVKEDLQFILGPNFIVFFIYLALRFVSLTSAIYAASISDNEVVHLKELFSSIGKPCLRLCWTWFYVTLLSIGYYFQFVAIAKTIYVSLDPSVSYIFMILTFLLYIYLSVAWVLSLVISVVDENCYGLEALGKSVKLVKGMSIKGFSLNLVLTIVAMGILQGLSLIRMPEKFQAVGEILVSLTVINLMSLVEIFGMTVYTVFHNVCKKKAHGEDDGVVDWQIRAQYTKIGSSDSLIADENLP